MITFPNQFDNFQVIVDSVENFNQREGVHVVVVVIERREAVTVSVQTERHFSLIRDVPFGEK